MIDPVKSADEGLYDCIVFNDGGNERSTAARLTFISELFLFFEVGKITYEILI